MDNGGLKTQGGCCPELAEQVSRLEEELRDYRIIFHHLHQFVGVLDTDGRVLDMNRPALAFAGARKEEVLGLPFAETPWWTHAGEVQAQVRQALQRAAAGEASSFLAVLKDRQGQPRHVDSSLVPVKSSRGRVVFLVYEGRDMSARVRFEAALRASEEQYRNIFEAAQDGFCIMDLEGRVLEVNSALCRMHGYSREELFRLEPLAVIHPDFHRYFPEMLSELKQGRACGRECTHIRKDGSSFAVDVHLSPISYQGRPHIFAALRDISERRQAENEKRRLEALLRQAQKMEAIGTLAGGIAHDFNNILTAIMGYTDLAAYLLPAENPAREHLRAVNRAGVRARELVEQILTFSRQGEQEQQPMQIGPVVKEVLKLLRASLPTSIEIRQKISEDPGLILADPGQIHQILLNLCTNAADAMATEGGLLEVELCRDPEEAGQLLLVVRDTGSGIPAKLQERIFDPFFTTKERGKGTGLGLSVVHGIVESHGGRISVESGPGQGTGFFLRFPLIAREEAVGQPHFDTAPPPGGTERLMVVEDEESVLLMEKELLESLGYTVAAFADSMAALEFFATHAQEIDLVVTDQTMPLVSGTLLVRELRKIRAEVPVILCTGYSAMVDAEKAAELGVREFLMKPFDVRTLALAVRRALAAPA
jgi:PAS domain S-box-containing protein